MQRALWLLAPASVLALASFGLIRPVDVAGGLEEGNPCDRCETTSPSSDPIGDSGHPGLATFLKITVAINKEKGECDYEEDNGQVERCTKQTEDCSFWGSITVENTSPDSGQITGFEPGTVPPGLYWSLVSENEFVLNLGPKADRTHLDCGSDDIEISISASPNGTTEDFVVPMDLGCAECDGHVRPVPPPGD